MQLKYKILLITLTMLIVVHLLSVIYTAVKFNEIGSNTYIENHLLLPKRPSDKVSPRELEVCFAQGFAKTTRTHIGWRGAVIAGFYYPLHKLSSGRISPDGEYMQLYTKHPIVGTKDEIKGFINKCMYDHYITRKSKI